MAGLPGRRWRLLHRRSARAPRYSTNGLWITDAQGRDLFLRGVDVTGAEDTPTADPLPYGPSDFTAMRADGATVVRLPIAWALIEPHPGQFDQAAIDRAVQVVEWAGAAGLDVVLDMHQYLWSPCFGGNGMPAWAVPNCPATAPTNLAVQEADVLVAENAFWHSATLQADFTQAWVRVADAVGQPYYLLGYDLLNEPGPGLIPNEVFELSYLAPFYRAVGTALRDVDPGSLLFVEPSILNGLVNGSSEFLAPIGLPRVVFEPHQYGAVSFNADAGVGVADLAGPPQFAPDLTLDLTVARRLHAAIWLGEWGAINPAVSYRPTQYVADDLTEQDQLLIGSAYWSYDSSLRGPNTAIGAELTRVTPFAIAGTPHAISTGTRWAVVFPGPPTAGTPLRSLPGVLPSGDDRGDQGVADRAGAGRRATSRRDRRGATGATSTAPGHLSARRPRQGRRPTKTASPKGRVSVPKASWISASTPTVANSSGSRAVSTRTLSCRSSSRRQVPSSWRTKVVISRTIGVGGRPREARDEGPGWSHSSPCSRWSSVCCPIPLQVAEVDEEEAPGQAPAPRRAGPDQSPRQWEIVEGMPDADDGVGLGYGVVGQRDPHDVLGPAGGLGRQGQHGGRGVGGHHPMAGRDELLGQPPTAAPDLQHQAVPGVHRASRSMIPGAHKSA